MRALSLTYCRIVGGPTPSSSDIALYVDIVSSSVGFRSDLLSSFVTETFGYRSAGLVGLTDFQPGNE